MPIPVFDNPGYGAEFASLQAAADKNRGSMVEAELGAYADVIRGIMSNSKNIAEVSGVGALDTLAQRFGGAQGNQPIFGTAYGGKADDLRLQLAQAEIGAKNRSGMGGGGSDDGSGDGAKSDEVTIRMPDGSTRHVKSTTLAELRGMAELTGAPLPTVIDYGESASGPTGTPAPTPPPQSSAVGDVGAVAGPAATGPAPSAVGDSLINRINADTDKTGKEAMRTPGGKIVVRDRNTGETEEYDDVE